MTMGLPDLNGLDAWACGDRRLRVQPSALSSRRLLEIRDELRGVALDWLREVQNPAVLGFGYGVRWVDGQPTDEPVFQVFTRTQLNLDAHGPAGLFPKQYRSIIEQKVTRAPGYVTGRGEETVAVECHEPARALTMEKIPLPGLRHPQAVLVGGCSIGHPNVTAGTLGIPVFEDVRGVEANPRALVLSNCHVLAEDPRRPMPGTEVIHPASSDGGDLKRNVVGRLFRGVPLSAGMGAPNRVDAAVAELTDRAALGRGLHGLGEVPRWRADADLPIGTRVAKVGRSTGLSFGLLRAVGVSYKVDYNLGQPLLFTDQILTTHLAEGGDSGSVLLSLGERPAVAGLLLGGSHDVTIASPIQAVHEALGVLTARERWAPAAAQRR